MPPHHWRPRSCCWRLRCGTVFPLLEYDTGGYLARWFEGTLEVSRSTVYGPLSGRLRPHRISGRRWWSRRRSPFWVIVADAAQAHKLGGRPIVLLVTGRSAVGCHQHWPWLASLLLTDIFRRARACWRFISWYFHADTLMRWGACSGSRCSSASPRPTHSATVGGHARAARRGAGGSRGLRPRLMPIAGKSAAASRHSSLAPSFSSPPTTASHGKSRGPRAAVALFVRPHAAGRHRGPFSSPSTVPIRAFRLLRPIATSLPDGADAFFLGRGCFSTGSAAFRGLNAEMRTIVLESLRDYPLWQARKPRWRATARQLGGRFRTGEGVLDSTWQQRTA